MTEDLNREAWLGKAAQALAERFLADEKVPAMRISVGWAGGGSNPDATAGQCWPTTATDDGVAQIFISPSRGEKDTQAVLATLLHEMIHAVDDCKDGHKGNFVRIAKKVGFVPKWTSSQFRSDELSANLDKVAELVGLFPHAAINHLGRAADKPKKQAARMIKLECPDDGYLVRTSQKWIDIGNPTCPCGAEMEVA